MPTIIMLGNPGAGKSTLLTSLVEGSTVFASGTTKGSGKTTALQRANYKGNTYVDTPGLSDVKMRAQAAAEIEKALKIGGQCKVFFVVTLESGRVRPDDVATIRVVLESITQIKPNQYSILINKLAPKFIEDLHKSSKDSEELKTCLLPPSIQAGTHSIFYVPMNLDWLDQENKWDILGSELLSFIANAPDINASEGSIQAIQHPQFEKILEELRQEIKELREDNAKLRRAMEERDRRDREYQERLKRSAEASSSKQSNNARNMEKVPTSIIMLGNPGSGKSTLLTSLVNGQHQFHSGVSIGRGKTVVLQEAVYDGTNYIDTPGLSDVRLREKAAAAIKDAFRKSGNFKVFFVMTLESGRVRPDDVATMKLVLESLTQIKDNQFSIIVNKVTPSVAIALNEDEEERKELAACLVPPSLAVTTDSIFFVPLNEEWSDQNDKWGELDPELLAFIKNAPSVYIPAEMAASINLAEFEGLVVALRDEIRQLREENQRLRQQQAQKPKKGKRNWYSPPIIFFHF